MVLKVLLKKVVPLVLKQVFPAIEPLQEYVFKPNKNDKSIEKLEKKVKKLGGMAHPPIFAKKELEEILDRLEKVEGHIKRLDAIAHPPFFSSEEKANMLDRIRQVESIDYDIQLRGKDEL